MPSQTPSFDPVERVNDSLFDAEIDKLIRYAEDQRLDLMRSYRSRSALASICFILFVLLGSTAFGYFLFFEGKIYLAIVCVLLSVALPYMVHVWAERPIREYKVMYKQSFMPRLAKLLGGMRFFPRRGVGTQVLSKTGVLPKFESYSAEDCFMGNYK